MERLAELRRRERERAPVVVGRERVVGVGHGDEVGNRRPPGVGGGHRAAARRGEEERLRDTARVEHDLARRGLDGRARLRRLGGDAAVDLAARVRVEVEAAGLEVRQRIRAGRDRLGLQRLGRPRVRHLGPDDALQVRLEPDDVDRLELGPGGSDLDLAAIRAPELERRRARTEEERAGQRLRLRGRVHLQLQVRVEGRAPGGDVVRLSGCVRDGEVRCGGDRELRLPLREQDTHATNGRRADRRAGVVVGEDAAVAEPVLRVAVRAVLAHPDTVPPAVAAHSEERRGQAPGGDMGGCVDVRGGDRRSGEDEECESERSAHGEDPDQTSGRARG